MGVRAKEASRVRSRATVCIVRLSAWRSRRRRRTHSGLVCTKLQLGLERINELEVVDCVAGEVLTSCDRPSDRGYRQGHFKLCNGNSEVTDGCDKV